MMCEQDVFLEYLVCIVEQYSVLFVMVCYDCDVVILVFDNVKEVIQCVRQELVVFKQCGVEVDKKIVVVCVQNVRYMESLQYVEKVVVCDEKCYVEVIKCWCGQCVVQEVDYVKVFVRYEVECEKLEMCKRVV